MRFQDHTRVLSLYCRAQTLVDARTRSGSGSLRTHAGHQQLDHLHRPRPKGGKRLDAEWTEVDAVGDVGILSFLKSLSRAGNGRLGH